MFVWMTALLGVILAPFLFVLGRPVALATAVRWLPPDVAALLPWSRHTPLVVWVPWGWLRRLMDGRVSAFAMPGHVVAGPHATPRTMAHECIHVAHMSAVSPVLLGLVYLGDLALLWPFRRRLDSGWTRHEPIPERLAYRYSEFAGDGETELWP